MTAPVRIEAEAWGDLRFAALARACGLADLEHALIRVAKIWSWQTEHYTPDAPTYVVDELLIDSVLGDGGTAKMVRARLAEEVPEGIRIKGSEGRVEWLWEYRERSRKGGEATKRKHASKTLPGNSSVANKTGPHGLATSGAKRTLNEGLPSPVPSLSPEEKIHPPRAILPSTEHAPCPVPTASSDLKQNERHAIGTRTWTALRHLRDAVARELRIDARPLALMDIGEREMAARIVEAGDRAEADCVHVLDMAAREARRDQSVKWLTGALFEPKNWRRFIGMTAEDFVEQRAGPRGRPSNEDPDRRRSKAL